MLEFYFRFSLISVLTLFGVSRAQAQVSLTASLGTTSGTFTTLNDAFTAINAGTHKGVITISITANTTEPATPVPLLASGSSSSSYTSITIKPSGGNFTINSASSPSANRGIIELAGADNVTIDGDDPSTAGTQNLTIQSVTSTSAGIACIRLSSNSTTGTDGANNITVKNCIIIGARSSATATTTSYGIQFSNGTSTSSSSTGAYSSQNTQIQGNTITRCYYGIHAIGTSTTYLNTGLQIQNNIVGSATSSDNIGFRGITISYTATSAGSSSAQVTGNDVRAGDYGTTGYSVTICGVEVGAANAGAVVQANNIHDINQPSTGGWGAYGLLLSSSTSNSGIVVTNNFIRDCKMYVYSTSIPSTWMPIGVYISSGVTNLVFSHNTVVMNTQLAASSTFSSACVIATASVTFSQFLNNILVNNHASSGAYAFYTAATSTISSANVNNNNYFVNAAARVGYYASTNYSTLASWQTATGKDGASISENPPFISATNLHLVAGAATLLESGGETTTVTGVTKDIDNQTRPGTSTYGFGTAPDIGADEFDGQVVYTCTTPTPGATVASSTSICLGSSVALSLTTATTGTGVTYQWQSSPDNVTYTDISGATSATYTATPTSATWYKCKVSCKNGPVTTSSTAVLVGFTNNVASTTPGVRCGTGTVNLAATTTAGTAKWYTTATGGAPLGSGSPFTTPSIGTTTTYYVAAETNASGTGVIGSGGTTSSSSGSSPFSQTWESNHSQYLILASELSAAGFGPGNFTALSFNIATKNSTLPFSSYTIKLAHTTATSMTGYLTPTFTTVYGPSSYVSVAGANNFSFVTSFSWDGSSNIIVDVCFDNDPTGAGTFWSSSDVLTATTKSYTAVYGMYADNSVFCGATSGGTFVSSTALPVITFTGNKVCSSPRSAVTATVNTAPAFTITGTQTVCNNAVATLSVSSPLANYNSYVWSPAAGLFTDAACTTPYVSGASASTVYAKTTTAGTVIYTCNASNSTTLCAGIDRDTVTTLPATVTAVATPTSICVSGNTTLTLNPSPSGFGAASYQWAMSTDNTTFTDVASATSSSFTTPTLSSTRYYRVNIRNSAGSSCLNSVSDTALVYNPTLTSATGASRCGPGSVTLSASATDGTINWFAAATGGSSLGTGTTFTTPTLFSTTTYYAQVRATPDLTVSVGSGGTTVGTSTGETGLTPFSGYYEGQHTQHLFLASDLTAAGLTPGNISSMSFNVSTKNSTLAYTDYTLKMAATTATSLSAGLIAPTFTTVFGPANYTTASGTNTFNFSSGFVWDGTSNIVLDVCFSNDPSGAGTFYSSNDIVTATSMGYTATYGWYMDNSALCGTTGGLSAGSSKLPVVTFNKLGCFNGRTAVTATINALPTPTISPATGPIQICDGNTTTLTGGGGGTYQWRNASGILSGSTSSTFTTGTSGSYQVIVTNAAGCKDSSAIVAVNVNPTPTVSINPSSALAICADSSQKYTSVVSGPGLTYQWFNGATPITGATTDNFTANTSGTYTLRVYLGTCSDTSNAAVLTVNALPAASFTKTGPTGAICLGSTLELTALSIPSSSTYQWQVDGFDIPGATGQKYSAPKGGMYTVRIKDSNNCRKVSDGIRIINTPMGIPDLSPKDVRFCQGAEIMLYANAGPFAASYVWTKDGVKLSDTTDKIPTGLSGIYDVTATDIYGCKATSGKVTVTVDSLPTKPVIVQTGTILSTVKTYTSYQWYRNGKLIPGATKRTYTLSFEGVYHVVVTNPFDCINVSDKLSVQSLSVANTTTSDILVRLYPNPSQSMVNIDAPETVNLVVRDMQGKTVLEVTDAKQVDMAPYADGLYLFTITDKEGRVIKMDKVIKRTE